MCRGLFIMSGGSAMLCQLLRNMPEKTPSPSGDTAPPGKLHPNLQRYLEQYKGLTRGELSNRDPVLYQRLRRAGLLEEIPKKTPDAAALLASYHKRYEGLTPGQLSNRDPVLYRRLRKAGLLEDISTKRPQKRA
jgi:hypothetical protein